jgi:hypothetical protein
MNRRSLSPIALAFLVLLIAVTMPSSPAHADQIIDLSGTWLVLLDGPGSWNPAAGSPTPGTFENVTLPGSLRDSGLGAKVGPHTQWIGGIRKGEWDRPVYAPYRTPENFKVPFWLQPERHHVGWAWYRKSVTIPPDWANRRIVLHLERPHWRTKIFVNDKPAGEGESLATPHRFDLSAHLSPGDHVITIGIDNSLAAIDVGHDSHSVSDHTQTAWHGIVGQIALHSTPAVWISDLHITPDAAARSLRIRYQLDHQPSQSAATGTLSVSASFSGKPVASADVPITPATPGEVTLSLGPDAKLWNEFNPNLYDITVTLTTPAGSHTLTQRVGLRHIATAGSQFTLNGKPIFFRGTLECAIFPLTGYPPTDVEAWRRIIRICKAHGLNHIRFHSWCPPKAAFDAADELGFYYQIECSSWPNASTKVGVGQPIDGYLYREADRILAEYGNHPSFMLLCAGNEPGGPEQGGKYLGPWVEHYKARESRMLITSGSGWPTITQSQFHVTPKPRIQQWGEGIKSRINAKPPETVTDYRTFVAKYPVPVISHEIGQWCTFPDFDEMARYTGSLKARNFEIFRDQLQQAGMLDQARDFLMASGRLQVLCYKEEIESALRTPGFGGFQLLDLHDFPGQGTALVGMLDPFWNSKPYMTPQDFTQFCGPIVPLARLPRRILTTAEPLIAQIDLYHFGPFDLSDTPLTWALRTDDNRIVASGSLPASHLPAGKLHTVGNLTADLSNAPAPARLRLTVGLNNSEISNSWDIFVYPPKLDTAAPEGVHVTSSMDDKAIESLKAGGRVVWFADPATVRTDVILGFSSIFWNTNWTGNQPPHTLGILCDPKHPALAQFPTDSHSNWQWWELINRAATMELDSFPPSLRPIVQVVPDWNRPKRLGLFFECKVGSGRLLVCSIDLTNDLNTRPVARQMRQSLLSYAGADAFNPASSLTVDQVRSLFKSPAAQP